MSLNLQLATEADYEDFLQLSQLFFEESPFHQSATLSVEKLTQLFSVAIDLKHTLVLILLMKEGHQSVGMLVGYASESPMFEEKIASELAWYIEPSHRGSRKAVEMIYAYEEWAHRVGCKLVSMSLLPTLKDVSKVYERMGYEQTEISYLKAI